MRKYLLFTKGKRKLRIIICFPVCFCCIINGRRNRTATAVVVIVIKVQTYVTVDIIALGTDVKAVVVGAVLFVVSRKWEQ